MYRILTRPCFRSAEALAHSAAPVRLLAGHSHWHNTRHRKQAQDAEKQRKYQDASKSIRKAALEGNILRIGQLVQDAKRNKVPDRIIQRALLSATEQDKDNPKGLYEFMYGNICILIRAFDKKSTASMLRSILTKHNATMDKCKWAFREQLGLHVLHEYCHRGLEAGAKDVMTASDSNAVLLMDNMAEAKRIRTALDGHGNIVTTFYPKFQVTIKESETEKSQQLRALFEELNDNESVDRVWHNARFQDMHGDADSEEFQRQNDT